MSNNNHLDSNYNKEIEDENMTTSSDTLPSQSSLNDSCQEDRNNQENDHHDTERQGDELKMPSLLTNENNNNNFDSDTISNTADPIEDLVRQ